MTSYDFESMTNATVNNAGLSALFIGMIIFSMILSLIMIISYWKIFTRKGKPGWAILVPIYNVIVLIQIAELSMIYFLLLFVPLVNIYAIFKINISIANKFDKTAAFGIGMIFLPVIFIPLLAFSDNETNHDKTETSSNFDAMNVIKDSNVNVNDNVIQNNGIDVNSNIVTEPSIEIKEPTIENSIPTMDNQTNNVNAVNVEPVVENNVTEQSNIQSTIDNQTNGVNAVNVEPVVENNVTEQSNIQPTVDNQTNGVNAFNVEPVVENNVIEQSNIQSTIDNQTNGVNAVNVEPVVENNVTKQNNVQPTIDNQTNNVNAVNVEPVVENNVEEQKIEIPVETLDNNFNQTGENSKKYCKNCGNEMPNIVSICPKCGTDNE